jgi:ketosteroid isomerase-like protein
VVQSWLAKKMLARDMARLRAGDHRSQLRRVAKDVRFRFPGSSSWSTELVGKEELDRWLERFARVGLQIYPDEVIAHGPPWNTTLCVRGTIHLDAPSGERVFENRYVIWGRMSWGFLREYEVYEDTERSTALDAFLATIGELESAPRPRPVTAA